MSESSLPRNDRRLLDHPILGPAPTRTPVSISFDGQPIEALAGDTVAAALLAAGFREFRTMPRTGEPRGGYCFVGRCTDCLMIIDGRPNEMACTTLVRDGMRIERQIGLGTATPNEDIR